MSLLIEAGRTNIQTPLTGDTPSLVVVDNREFPLMRYEEANDLAVETRNRLGGILDLRKPREAGPFPNDKPGWEFAALTYGGIGELLLTQLVEDGYADSWETLYGLVRRTKFESLPAVRAREA